MKSRFLTLTIIVCLLSGLSACKKEAQNARFSALILTDKEQQKVEADNRLTFNLFKDVVSNTPAGKNVMLSPLSVSMAIAMASNGSSNQTLNDITTAMQFTSFTEDEINSYYQKIIKSLPELDPSAQLNIANSIWYRNGFNVLPNFLQTNTTNYQAKAEALDFGNPTSKDIINSWVSEQTNGKIPTIIDQISSNMMMYLINAVYFKSTWKYQFDKSKTAKGNFDLDVTNKVNADFMYAEKVGLRTTADQNSTVYELPYGNDIYSMVIVLPKNGNLLKDVVSNIDANKWNTWMANLSPLTTDVKMPKFKFSYENKLNDELIGLGMGKAFSDEADFSRINGTGGLKISEVKHKTFIEVNEEGTEAAAVTSVGMVLTSLPATMVINRPFMFAIREKHTGLILFTGTVNNPLLAN